MRLRVRLPEVRPDEYAIPLNCPYGCGGRYFALHDQCHKTLGDPTYQAVQVRRDKCVSCRRSFRVHPTGVSQHHRSQRLRGIGVLLYAALPMPWPPLAGKAAAVPSIAMCRTPAKRLRVCADSSLSARCKSSVPRQQAGTDLCGLPRRGSHRGGGT